VGPVRVSGWESSLLILGTVHVYDLWVTRLRCAPALNRVVRQILWHLIIYFSCSMAKEHCHWNNSCVAIIYERHYGLASGRCKFCFIFIITINRYLLTPFRNGGHLKLISNLECIKYYDIAFISQLQRAFVSKYIIIKKY
jgi:hypothetical protein